MECFTWLMQLTVWCILLFWKLRLPEVIKKFPTFYGMWKFITLFTRNHHWSLYGPAEFSSHHPILFLKYILVLSSYLCVDIQNSLFFSALFTKTRSALLFCTIHATHTHKLPIPSSLMSPWLLIQSLFLTVQCPPTSCHFCPIRFEYFLW
jgi:hypothetical protein